MSAFQEQVDVLIVGSGPCGAAYARTLANLNPCLRLLMIDAGPVITDPPGDHVANLRDPAEIDRAQIASQGPHDHAAYAPMSREEMLARRRGGHDTSMLRRPGLFRVGSGPIDGDGFPASHASHNVGGMGSHWFGACPRPSDEERVPFIPRTVMDDALEAAAKLLRVSKTQFANSHIAGPLRNLLSDLFDAGRPEDRRVQPMPMAVNIVNDAVERTGSAHILGDLVTGRAANFALRAETIARKVLYRDGRAEGVELYDRRGASTYSVGARAVVIAADSLHTPQLLFASGIRPKALGRYLNEHPQLTVLAEYVGMDPGGEVALAHGGGVLGDRTVVSRMASGVMWAPYLGEAFPYHVQTSQVEPASLLDDDREVAKRSAVLSVSFFLCSDLQFDNCVSFSETETDWLGRPKMSLRFRFSDGDLARIERARADQARVCAALGRVLPGHTPRMSPNGTSLHYQGTIRMGARDDGTSVCDADSRVWGFDNLHVAGNGVIPTMTAGNPTLTSVALSVLGARRIAQALA